MIHVDSGNKMNDAYIPATLSLAGKLLTPNSMDEAEISVLSAAYSDEFHIEQSSLSHEFAPYLYSLLNEKGITESLPVELIKNLHDSAISAAATTVARKHIIDQVGHHLAAAGIEGILLKGAAMDQ